MKAASDYLRHRHSTPPAMYLPPSLGVPACLLLVLSIAAPKVTLLAVSGFEQGIRAEDLLLVATFGLLLAVNIHKGLKRLIFAGTGGWLLVAFMAVSSSLGVLFIGTPPTSFVFAARWLEYLFLGAVATATVLRYQSFFFSFSKFYIFFNAAFAIAEGIIHGVSERYEGLSAGPWEISSVVLVLLIALLPVLSSRELRLYGLSVALVILAAKARIQLGAFAVIVLLDPRLRRVILRSPLMVAAAIAVMLIQGLPVVVEAIRFERLNYESLSTLFELIANAGVGADFNTLASASEGVDLALLARLLIWLGFIDPWLNGGLYTALMGLGPGAGGVVVDGLYIRLLTEFGALGIAVFVYFVRCAFLGIPSHSRVLLLGVLAVISLTNDPITSQRIFCAISVSIAMLISLNPETGVKIAS